MAKTQKSTQKQTTATEQKQSTQQKQKKSTQQSKELTVRLSELTEEQFKDVLTEAVQTAEAELKAEEEQKKAEAQQTAEEQKQTEAEQTVTEIAQSVSDRDLAELKAVADSFEIKKQKFVVALQSAKELQTAEGEGTDNSVFIGRYGFGSNGKGELVSVWCRRKATDRKAIMYTDWMSNGQKKSTEKQKHAFPCDFGLRFSQDDFKMFSDVAECRAIIDSFDTEHAEVKHNEPRFSFKTLSAVTEALAKLYNAYESAQQTAEQTKEAEQTEAEQKEA